MNVPFLPLADVDITVENHRFWNALRDDRLELPFCSTCEAFVWYPRMICPGCQAEHRISWRTLPGTGRVYSYSVVTKGSGRWKDSGPYVVAYVQLDSGLDGIDGPRILTNIVGDGAHKNVAIDSPVRMVVDRDMKNDAKLGNIDRTLLRFVFA